uniref:AB hydrolase-1 domain-containing protein n=1 Tax=Aegilops tauschii TaxID=37682 RepID=M8BVN2_AEGTA
MANRVYAIDLIGYGYSDKPNPREFEESFYTFETWGEQLNTFCAEVVKSDAFFICNSIGGLVGLQAAVMKPQTCKGIVLLDISLRMLHINKQPWFGRPFIRSFQNLLRNTVIGKLFFNAVATPESVKNILCQRMPEAWRHFIPPALIRWFTSSSIPPSSCSIDPKYRKVSFWGTTWPSRLTSSSSHLVVLKPHIMYSVLVLLSLNPFDSKCYHDTSAVTDELVQMILQPGLDPGAVDVFLEFICYSGGPLPEDLLPLVKCPVLVAWGEKDPWEPVELGRAYGSFDAVEDFVVLPNVGHCPQDEAPELVNPLVESFVKLHS